MLKSGSFTFNCLGKKIRPFLLLVLFILVYQGCAPKPELEKKGFVPLSEEKALELACSMGPKQQELTHWQELQDPLQKSLDYVSSKPQAELALNAYAMQVSWSELRQSLSFMLKLLKNPDFDPQDLVRYFTWYELRPESLFTGYFEPQVEASLEREPGYAYPLHRVPKDMKKVDLGQFHPRWEGQTLIYRLEQGEVKPYYERSQIDGQEVLAEQNSTIAWARDPVDIFFLQIQGSGRLILPDGEKRHIVYAGKNGRQYVSLGRVLVKRGLLTKDEVSMQSIRKCLDNNPHLVEELLFTNPSYVFFRLASDGPYGAMGRILTPRVSLATDPKLLPLGSVLVYNVDLPAEDAQTSKPLTALGSAQDIGGAIKNHHLDIFFGCGERAGFFAGHMQNRGRVFLLLLKENLSERQLIVNE